MMRAYDSAMSAPWPKGGVSVSVMLHLPLAGRFADRPPPRRVRPELLHGMI